MIACVGHACWHAVTMVPSSIDQVSLPLCTPPALAHAFFALILAAWMRCMQKEHFSITPRERTVTSGLNCMRDHPAGFSVIGL